MHDPDTPGLRRDGELVLRHLWPLLPDEAQQVFALEWADDGRDSGIQIRRTGDEWTITTGGRLQDGWWVKVRSDLGVACLGPPDTTEWTVLRAGWRL
jgi:hypothetical protein